MGLQKHKKILVHTCCAPCSGYCFEKLVNDGYEIAGYFYNPNIHPETEYKKRLDELISYSEQMDFQVLVQEEPPETWFEAIKGLEQEKEGGKRCETCLKLRLEKAALFAKENGFEGFTTVLTISPHKNSALINQTGNEIARKHGIEFIEENFKKHDGFKKSLELSEKCGFYRQNYCGCVYSQRT